MDLINKTAHELRDMLRGGKVTSEALVEAHFDRIDKVDSKVKAYISLDRENALEKAREIDKKRVAGEKLPDLAGIPMAIKDNICTEGVKTTCASRMLENFIPPYSATSVELLEEAGAIMLGKTNLDEFAMGTTTESSFFHKTSNPWDLERTPGGSSGGSAAALAAGQAVFALGTDTGGSIRQPAAHCSLVGLKPTNGLTSRYGVISYASSFDTLAPMTKDVEDMALVMNTLVGKDPKDSTSLEGEKVDYLQDLGKDIKGMKIGFPASARLKAIDPEILQGLEKAKERLEEEGAIIKELDLPLLEEAVAAYYIIASSEGSSNLARFDGVAFGHRADSYTDVDSLYANSRGQGFGPEVKRRIVLGTFALSEENYEDYYKKAMEVASKIREEYQNIFKEVDMLLSPNVPELAAKLGQKQDNLEKEYFKDIWTIGANIAGVPAISVPEGLSKEGLPIGIQLTANKFKEKDLLKVAYKLEKSNKMNKEFSKL